MAKRYVRKYRGEVSPGFWEKLKAVIGGTTVRTRVGVEPGAIADPGPGDRVVEMPLEDSLDLHTFQPRDVASVVDEYLYEAQKRGFGEVRVIHGRGKGVQRKIVQGVLDKHPAVAGYRTPPQQRGGWGATLVDLKPRTVKSR